ncbi:MAG: hypothetical protein K0S23_365 [Fluviicola sp.]|jgi:hypothetical protein|uniref:DUF3788 family protein n=1 Tax=Fluviicola sp. TaxID=1917219 RepID=UPI00262D996F|nr:DUF3788 family protein [Fluviicola sp.]MDF3026058.1 hypothetical protein [Fluviicola sp.]
MKSVFINKNEKPTNEDLKKALGETVDIWNSFVEFTHANDPASFDEWNFSGEKFGWSFRIKDKKRVLIYLLPRDKFFKVAFVFGQKATDQIMGSDVSDEIKAELNAAKSYAEGRGIRIEIRDTTKIEDIRKLIQFKIAN